MSFESLQKTTRDCAFTVLIRCKCVLRISCLLFLSILIFSFFSRAEAGRTVVAVQGVGTRPYDTAFEGFKTTLDNAEVHRVMLQESSREEAREAIRALSPDLVFAIGMNALCQAQNLSDSPVVYAMVLDAAAVSGTRRATGVSMEIDPEKQLATLLEALPQTRTIGILYDPERTGGMVGKIRTAAERRRISLIENKVIRARSVPLSGMEMMEKIDLFWMLPDTTVITPQNVEFLLMFAMESGTPILSFSEKYVGLGALLSIGVDPYDMGCQAAQMAEKILSGADADAIPGESARKAVITVNMKVARKLGIALDEKIMNQALIIE